MRKKGIRKKGIALLLCASMVIGMAPLPVRAEDAETGNEVQIETTAPESEEQAEVAVITAFEALDTAVVHQQLSVGDSETNITFPDSLKCTVEGADTLSEITGITWELDENESDGAAFDSSEAGSGYCYVYTPILPETDAEGNSIQVADDVELPMIYVQIEEPQVMTAAEETGANTSGNDAQTQVEPSESGSDAQTEGSASGDESSGVYELELKDGEYYDEQHVKYTLSTEDGTATVSGYDTSYVNDTNFPVDKVEAGNGWEITIPAKVSYGGVEYGVTTVGMDALSSDQLTKVEFSEDSVVTKIEEFAFYNSPLNEIILPETLTTIGMCAFWGNKIKSIYIPKNVSSIDESICVYDTELVEIKVDSKNETYNVGLGDVNCIVDKNGVLIQGCSASVIPNNVKEIAKAAFAGMDVTNVDFSNCDNNTITVRGTALVKSIFPDKWEIPECIDLLSIFSNSPSLKKLVFHDNNLFLGGDNEIKGFFLNCQNLKEVVLPSTIKVSSSWKVEDDSFAQINANDLTVYVGDFDNDSVFYQSLKAHAYEDHTGDTVDKYEKSETRHYILKKAYRVQFADNYAGYTLTKAKGCTTLTPIPGDSVRFVINAEDNYKKNLTVYAIDNSGNKTELTKDADGAYTLNNVNESNYKISLENYGECGHQNSATYTLSTDESGNSVIKRVCDDCGYEESGKVTATWRHGVKNVDSIAFYCDNANIKGTYAVTEAVVTGKSVYSYAFTPLDGICTGSGSVTVTEKTEVKISQTTNGITYSTVKSENDITNQLGNCSADIYYDSENNVLHIDGSETYVVSGTTTADRIVVNNMKPTTLVLSGLDIQMTALPAIDLQGTADVKILLADKTENILKSGGDYAALQKNNLAKNTPKLSIDGTGSLNAKASGDGAGIGAQSKKTASNITFQNATITANSKNGCGIGNGRYADSNVSSFSADDYIINGGKVMAESENFWGVSGGITVDGGGVVRDYNFYHYSNKFESSTNVIKGFICRYSFGRTAYSKMVGDATVDFQFNGDGLEIPENTTLTLGYNGQLFTNSGTVTNNGKLVLKGFMKNLNKVTNNGAIYNYAQYGDSLKDKVTGSGTLHEDTDHDGLCDICSDHEDIGNVTVTYDKDVAVMQDDTLTLSADVEPKKEYDGKDVTYQWYESDADGKYTKISGATTREYVQENCSLDVGTYTYRLQVLCDGIVRYIPFTVTVKESFSSLIGKALVIVNNENNQYSQVTLNGLNAALATVRSLSESSTQEEKWNAYNELEAALNTMKNAHTIVTLSCNPANSGILDGGGKYELGDQIILKAQAVDGFVFVGWYDTEQITESDQPLSTETTYNYGTVGEQTPFEISLYAVYKSNENRQLSITVGNGKVEYSYQNGTQTGTWNNSFTNNEFARGTYFTLTAKPNDGYTFLHWINQDGRVLSESLTYSFYLGDNMELQACYKTTESSEATAHYVIFKDSDGRILWTGDVSMNQGDDAEKYGTVSIPSHGIFNGVKFKQWKDASGNVLSTEEQGTIKVTGDMTIYAEYEPVSGLTLTVNGIIDNNTYTYGELVTVEALEESNGKYFSGWYIDDTLVSDNRVYSFRITENTSLVARYEGDAVIEQKPILNMTMSDRTTLENGYQTIVMNVNWSIPEGYEFAGAGIVRTLADDQRDNLTLENVDGNIIKNNPTKLTTKKGTMVYTLTLSTASVGKNVYAKGYMMYRNVVTGEVVTEYTNDIFTSNAGN